MALPYFPPAWASVIWVTSLTLSFMIRSYTFPTLLARVIPLSLEHFPFWPLPLYSLMILPSSHDLGMLSSSWTLFIILVRVLVVSRLASRNISLGTSSGPWLFFLLSYLIAFFVSFIVTGSWPCFLLFAFCSAVLTVVVISSVHSWNSGFPSLA